MEAEILSEHSSYSYESTPTFDSEVTDYTRYRPIDDLYTSGDLNLTDPSVLSCFPLNRWMNEDNQFKNDFIGLLRLIDRAKTSTVINNRDETGTIGDSIRFPSLYIEETFD